MKTDSERLETMAVKIVVCAAIGNWFARLCQRLGVPHLPVILLIIVSALIIYGVFVRGWVIAAMPDTSQVTLQGCNDGACDHIDHSQYMPRSESGAGVSAAATETPGNAPPPDVTASSQQARANQTPPAAPSSVDAGAETVRAFYSALGQGDGTKANSFMSLEKRAASAYQPDAIETFYGHMAEPLMLVSVSAAGAGGYEVRCGRRALPENCGADGSRIE